jgi:hypothetical protein
VRKRMIFSTVAAIVAVPVFASMTFALSWFSHSSSVKSTNVNIIYSAHLANGTTLKAGKYRLEIPLNTKTPDLKFYQNGKLVASVPAQVKKERVKNQTTEVDYNDQNHVQYMTQIRPGGLKKAFVITGSKGMKSGA